MAVELLLKEKVDPDSRSTSGQTPLWWVARNGHVGLVRLLVREHTDVESRDVKELTPLCWAARNEHLEMAKVLLKNKADVDAIDNSGTTVFHWAAWAVQEEMVSLLLEHGAETETKNQDSRTAAAVEKRSYSIVMMLLGKSAGVKYRYKLFQFRVVQESNHEVVGKVVYFVLDGCTWGNPGWIDSTERFFDRDVNTVLEWVTQKSIDTGEWDTEAVSEWVARREVSPLWRAAENNDNAMAALLQSEGAVLNFKECPAP